MARTAAKGEYRRFRDLIRKGIGMRSQAEVAETAGLTPAQLSRMLNAPFIGRPTIKTLARLANALEGIPVDALLEACGYTDDLICSGKREPKTPREERIASSFEERRTKNVNDLMRGFDKIRANTGTFRSFAEIFDMFNMLYACEDITFLVKNTEMTENEDKWVKTIEAVWTVRDDKIVNATTFLVFYVLTQTDKIILTNVAFDGKTLEKYHALPKAYEKHISPYVPDAPFISITYTGEDAKHYLFEQRLFSSIFDAVERQKIPVLVYGFGFYLDTELFKTLEYPKNFRAFLKNHMQSLSEKGREFTEKVLLDEDCLPCAFDSYEGKEGDGLGMLITEIIKKESGLPFAWFPADTEDCKWKEVNRSCVMMPLNFEQPFLETRREEAEQTAYRYAKELGLPQVEICYYQYMADFHSNEDAIHIEYDEEDKADA